MYRPLPKQQRIQAIALPDRSGSLDSLAQTAFIAVTGDLTRPEITLSHRKSEGDRFSQPPAGLTRRRAPKGRQCAMRHHSWFGRSSLWSTSSRSTMPTDDRVSTPWLVVSQKHFLRCFGAQRLRRPPTTPQTELGRYTQASESWYSSARRFARLADPRGNLICNQSRAGFTLTGSSLLGSSSCFEIARGDNSLRECLHQLIAVTMLLPMRDDDGLLSKASPQHPLSEIIGTLREKFTVASVKKVRRQSVVTALAAGGSARKEALAVVRDIDPLLIVHGGTEVGQPGGPISLPATVASAHSSSSHCWIRRATAACVAPSSDSLASRPRSAMPRRHLRRRRQACRRKTGWWRCIASSSRLRTPRSIFAVSAAPASSLSRNSRTASP